MDTLIPEDQLPIGEAMLIRLAERVPSVRWHELDNDVRQAFARHIALLDGELRRELGLGDVTEPIAFYNAYYWALVFAKRYQARYGSDAGVEQETFKLLERAPAGVDWGIVEQVNHAAQRA